MPRAGRRFEEGRIYDVYNLRNPGKVLGRRADVVSRWIRWEAARRDEDPKFAEAYDDLDRRLSEIGVSRER